MAWLLSLLSRLLSSWSGVQTTAPTDDEQPNLRLVMIGKNNNITINITQAPNDIHWLKVHGNLPPTALTTEDLKPPAGKQIAEEADGVQPVSILALPSQGDTVPAHELNQEMLGAPQRQFISGVTGQETNDAPVATPEPCATTERLEASASASIDDFAMTIPGYATVAVTFQGSGTILSLAPVDPKIGIPPPDNN
jgi:hypothetical protein